MERSPANDNDKIIITFEDGEIEATPNNTSLFRFVGKLALYNHIFIVIDEENGGGVYIFNRGEDYVLLEKDMLERHFPLHDNLREVSKCDKNVFDRTLEMYAEDLPNYPPDNWR